MMSPSGYNPVAEAYEIVKDILFNDTLLVTKEDVLSDLEEALGYLGEALE